MNSKHVFILRIIVIVGLAVYLLIKTISNHDEWSQTDILAKIAAGVLFVIAFVAVIRDYSKKKHKDADQ